MVANLTAVATQSQEIKDLHRIFEAQRAAYAKHRYPGAAERIAHLNKLHAGLVKWKNIFAEEVSKDFGHRSQDETLFAEVMTSLEGIKYHAKHVRGWMKPEKRHVPMMHQPASARIVYQPVGVVGIIVPWNYPIFLATGPLMAALAAGNRVMIKMSSFTPHLAEAMKKMIAENFAEDHVCVITGKGEVSDAFSRLAFDHILFTGSTNVGRQIMSYAAANLVPVTLELGGRNPTIIGRDKLTDPQTLAVIAGIKAIKRGQLCVTIDHLLVPEDGLQAFVAAFTEVMQQRFGHDNGANSASGIISTRHVERLQRLVDDAQGKSDQVIRIGRDMDPAARDMPFHIVVNPREDAQVVRDEIFGPILPIVTYQDTDDLIARINRDDTPLGIYAFTDDPALRKAIATRTRSGGVSFNIAVMHGALASMGFGGVGASGTGRHHGEEGFREFSNPRGFYERRAGGLFELITPPYGEATRQLVDGMVYPQVAAALGA